MPNPPALIAEAKRRVQQSAPNVTDEQWRTWLAQVEARGGRIVLQLDGARAEYDPTDF